MSDNRRLRKNKWPQNRLTMIENTVWLVALPPRGIAFEVLSVRVPCGFRCPLGPTVWLPCDYRLITVWFPVWFFTCVLLGGKSNGGHRLISVWFPCDFRLISVRFPCDFPCDFRLVFRLIVQISTAETQSLANRVKTVGFRLWIIAISLRRLLSDV